MAVHNRVLWRRLARPDRARKCRGRTIEFAQIRARRSGATAASGSVLEDTTRLALFVRSAGAAPFPLPRASSGADGTAGTALAACACAEAESASDDAGGQPHRHDRDHLLDASSAAASPIASWTTTGRSPVAGRCGWTAPKRRPCALRNDDNPGLAQTSVLHLRIRAPSGSPSVVRRRRGRLRDAPIGRPGRPYHHRYL